MTKLFGQAIDRLRQLLTAMQDGAARAGLLQIYATPFNARHPRSHRRRF